MDQFVVSSLKETNMPTNARSPLPQGEEETNCPRTLKGEISRNKERRAIKSKEINIAQIKLEKENEVAEILEKDNAKEEFESLVQIRENEGEIEGETNEFARIKLNYLLKTTHL